MAYLVGGFIGSLIGSYLVYSLLHWALFKRVISDRLKSHLSAAIASYPVGALIYGLSAADGSTSGFLIYLPSSLAIAALAYKRGREEARTVLA